MTHTIRCMEVNNYIYDCKGNTFLCVFQICFCRLSTNCPFHSVFPLFYYSLIQIADRDTVRIVMVTGTRFNPDACYHECTS